MDAGVSPDGCTAAPMALAGTEVDRGTRFVSRQDGATVGGRAVTAEVWPDSLDSVTDMDVDPARRIDEPVEAVGAPPPVAERHRRGTPGQQPSTSVSGVRCHRRRPGGRP